MGYKKYPYIVLIRDAVEAVRNKNLSAVAQKLILDNVIWGWTTHAGKDCGCPLWSEKALDALRRKKPNEKIPLHHEHTTPRSTIIQWIFSLGDRCTENDVLRILTEYAVAVVMLPEEHKQLHKQKHEVNEIPPHFDPSTLLRRYEDCAEPIKVMYATWNSGKASNNKGDAYKQERAGCILHPALF